MVIDKKRIGFISFRFAGIDGVTLESLKWVDVLEKLGHESFFCSGECTIDESHSMVFPEMHFNHPEILTITEECFNSQIRSRQLTKELHRLRGVIKKQLYSFINTYQLDMLILQNILAIPMNIPLSMAIVEVIAETRIPVIAHHHDFYWERIRYRVNCVQDILRGCFPPNLANVEHVVINSIAQQELGYRCGISSTIIANVMDFSNAAVGKDEYNSTLRKDLGIDDSTMLVLQPTRIVQRKGIEHAIELIKQLGKKATMVISHESGDEGDEYQQRVLDFAALLNVDVTMTAELVGEKRCITEDGKKIYDLNDVYAHADLVTYPSLIEGFGNALLETYYFKRPLLVHRYPVYAADIKTKGVKGIEFDSFITAKVVEDVHALLANVNAIEQMVETNYKIAHRYFSYEILSYALQNIIYQFLGI